MEPGGSFLSQRARKDDPVAQGPPGGYVPAMTTPELQEAKAKSRATWDAMAAGWKKRDDFMWSTSRLVGEWMVAAVDPRPGDTVLEIAAGPGDTGFVAAKLIENGKLISTDFSPEMVAVAEERAAELGIGNAEFRTMDAESMDLADDSVDGILCRWGFMLMTDPESAFRECRRVLKEGRRLALSVWGTADKNPWVVVPGMTMVQLGHPPGGDPTGPGGMFSLGEHGRIETGLRDAGFTNVSIEEMEVDWAFSSYDETWGFLTEVAGAIAVLVKELPQEDVERVRTAIGENLAPYTDASGALSVPGVTVNVVAS